MTLAIVALTLLASACATDPHVTAEQKRAVSGILRPATGASSTSTSMPSPTTLPAQQAPVTISGEQGSASSPATTSGSTTPAAAGGPPNVVGQSLSAAEATLQAAGYSTAAHPWAATCSTFNAVMQQVPPQDDNVQLFYCVHAS